MCSGAGACVECVTAAECNDGVECTDDLCANNVCTHVAAAVGAECSQGVCDEAGECVNCNDGGDCEDFGSECTVELCAQHTCLSVPWPQGTPCSNGRVCDGTGTCGCTTSAECDDGRECTVELCYQNSCLHLPLVGQPCGNEIPPSTCGSDGICGQCDFRRRNAEDNRECTTEVCTFNICLNAPRPEGTPCGDGQMATASSRAVSATATPAVTTGSPAPSTFARAIPAATHLPAGLPCGGGNTCDDQGRCGFCDSHADCLRGREMLIDACSFETNTCVHTPSPRERPAPPEPATARGLANRRVGRTSRREPLGPTPRKPGSPTCEADSRGGLHAQGDGGGPGGLFFERSSTMRMTIATTKSKSQSQW